MLCTNCQEEVKPVVAVDIDGTMGQYHVHFLRFAEQYLGKVATWDYTGERQFRTWFCLTYGVTPDVWHDVKLAYRQGGMKRSMPVYKGAANLCAAIRNAGAELWITTTRPYIRHDNVDPDTREWLTRQEIRYDYLLYDGHKYEKLHRLVGPERVVAILDDLVEELEEAERLFGQEVPILRVNVFNEATAEDPATSRYKQVLNPREAMINIIPRIKRWQETHNGH